MRIAVKAFPLPPCRALPVTDQAGAALEGAPFLVAAPVWAVPAAFVPAASLAADAVFPVT